MAEIVRGEITQFTTVLFSGGTTSSQIKTEGKMLAGITPGTGFSGTTVAVYNSVDGGSTFQPCYDTSGNAMTYTVAAGHFTLISPPVVGLGIIELVSSASEAAGHSAVVSFTP